jgi:hypothetical protein
MAKKYKRINSDLQNIHIKLNIGYHEDFLIIFIGLSIAACRL